MNAAGFMVRDRMTGLYRTDKGRYTKFGKIWRKLGHLKQHYVHYAGDTARVTDEIIVLMPVPGTNLLTSQIDVMSEKDIVTMGMRQCKEWREAETNKKDSP